MFLMAESRANRGSAEVLSACMQKEWRERLVEHALAVNQRLKNAWDWNTSRKRAERRRAELSTNALNKVCTYTCLYMSYFVLSPAVAGDVTMHKFADALVLHRHCTVHITVPPRFVSWVLSPVT